MVRIMQMHIYKQVFLMGITLNFVRDGRIDSNAPLVPAMA